MGTKLSVVMKIIISVLVASFGVTASYGVVATTKLNNQIKKEQALTAEKKQENQELADKNTLLVAEKTALAEDLAELEEQKLVLNEKLIILTTEKSTFQTKLDEVNNAKAEVQSKYDKLVVSEQELKASKASLETQLENAESENEELQADYDELLASEQQLKVDKTSLQNQLSKANADNAKLQADYNTLSAKETQLRADKALLETQLENAESENEELQADYDELLASEQQLKNDKSSLQTQLAQTNAEKAKLQEDYDTLLASEQQLALDKINLQTKLDESKAENEELQADYDALLESENQLTIEKTNLEAELATAKEEKEQLQADYDALLESENQLTIEKTNLETQLATAKEENEQLQADYDALLESENQLTIEKSNLQDQLDAKNLEYNTLNEEYQELVQEYATLENDYNALDQEYTSLQQQYNELEEEYNILLEITNPAPETDLEPNGINKIVLMIGDGMGVNHIACAETYLESGDVLNMQTFKYSGESDPDSKTTEEGGRATDSAAGATAVATGSRVYNDYVSMDKEGNDLETIAERAKKQGLGVGIVTTDYLFEATPAAFYAHTNNRKNYIDIRKDQYLCGFDLFLGADAHYDNLLVDDDGYYYNVSTVEEGVEYTEGYIYELEQQKIIDAGYTYITDYFTLDITSEKIFGAFPEISRSVFTAPPSKGRLDGGFKNTKPCLSQLTEFAIQYMETNFPQGYFLMIEDNDIDEECENWNDTTQDKMTERYITGDMVECVMEFDRSIGIVKNALANCEDNYAIMVTADHGTGSLVEENGVEDIYGFWSSQHDAWMNVPYYIQTRNAEIRTKLDELIIAKKAEEFAKDPENVIKYNYINNYNMFELMSIIISKTEEVSGE